MKKIQIISEVSSSSVMFVLELAHVLSYFYKVGVNYKTKQIRNMFSDQHEMLMTIGDVDLLDGSVIAEDYDVVITALEEANYKGHVLTITEPHMSSINHVKKKLNQLTPSTIHLTTVNALDYHLNNEYFIKYHIGPTFKGEINYEAEVEYSDMDAIIQLKSQLEGRIHLKKQTKNKKRVLLELVDTFMELNKKDKKTLKRYMNK